ncbi:hypothetical protein N0V90_005230 [Kalmusia sp. IMI 367209]|nr:hypothetical protein N0V90_005230 [Kalmusia sp. IMI 367209]
MVLEAFAAVGFASNIIQFVQFSCELISLTTSIRKGADGSSSSHADLEAIANDLQEHIRSLDSCPDSNRNLQQLVNRAKSIAKDLLDVVDNIRKTGQNNGKDKHPKWSSFRQALEIIWKKEKMAKFQSNLESLRDQLQYHFVTDIRWASKDTSYIASPSSPWPLEELQKTLKLLAAEQTISTRFYFHIDGLDEYAGDHFKVIDIIQELSHLPAIKLCVSSRPWNQFQHTIGQSNHGSLQLHTLTREDIEMFAQDSILKYRNYFSSYIEEQQYSELIHEIVRKAQGVFLWVRLVIRSLRNGLINDDQVSLLRKRLDELPSDLGEFFEHILNSVDTVYRECMARTFLTALAVPKPLELVHYSFLEEVDPDFGWRMPFSPLDDDDIQERLNRTKWRLNGRYKGLLDPSSESEVPRRDVKVDFLHGTLRDFLETPRIMTFLQLQGPPDFDPHIAACGAYLAEVKSTNPRPLPQHFAHVLAFAQNVAKSSHKFALEYSVIDHVEALWQSIWTSADCDTFEEKYLAINIALHIRRTDYVWYRIENSKTSLDFDRMLMYACCLPEPRHQTFAAFIAAKFFVKNDKIKFQPPDQLRKEKRAHNEDNNRSELILIEMLLCKQANPLKLIEGVSIWRHFLTSFVKEVRSDYKGDWDIVRTLIKHGVNPCGHADRWIKIIWGARKLVEKDFTIFMEGFHFLLEHGLNPNGSHYGSSIWIEFMALIRRKANWFPPNGTPFRNLIRHFLRRGAILQALMDSLWLKEVLIHIKEGRTLLCGSEIILIFEMSLQHGLDPNQSHQNSTLWEQLLQSFEEALVRLPGNSEFHGRVKDILVCFLNYRADPCSQRLHRLIGFHTADPYHLGVAEASVVKTAVLRELNDIRSYEQGLLAKGLSIDDISTSCACGSTNQ